MLSQTILERKAAYFNLLKNLNVGTTLIVFYILSFFAVLAFSVLINELSRRIRFGRRKVLKIPEKIASTLKSFQIRKFSAIGVFVLFSHHFLWATQLFFTNNIKTNKVVG